MERIAEQTGLRYKIENQRLTITPDTPYLHLYQVNYVNMTRDSSSEVIVSTQIASTGSAEVGQGGGGQTSGNDSNTQITNKSTNRFWETLEKNLTTLLAETGGGENVVINPESGLISVRATHKQHAEIQKFLDRVTTRAQRQVLIEATVTEVTLTDRYQAGIDWQRIAGDYSYIQTLMGGNIGASPAYSIEYNNPNSKFGDISAIVRLLEQFGSVKVLSSPKIMALNNQTSILKVVDNIVYFTTEVQIQESESRTTETLTTRYRRKSTRYQWVWS
jgi:general secretion pathway protein D